MTTSSFLDLVLKVQVKRSVSNCWSSDLTACGHSAGVQMWRQSLPFLSHAMVMLQWRW